MDITQKFSVFFRILGCRFLGMRMPISCHYSITNRCPWQCAYCSFKLKDKTECNTEEAKRIISDLARNGNVRIHLTGGEPALREDLGELVKEAKKNKIFVTMATTGFRFPHIWERIRDIDIFFLSFDGPKEIHDQQRGGGSFDTLFQAIDLLQAKSKKFWTTTVITKKNIDHIDYILDTAKRMKFRANFHLLYYTATETYLRGALHPNSVDTDILVTEDYRRILEYLLKRKRTDMQDVIGDSSSYLKFLSEWNDYAKIYSPKRSRFFSCWAGRMFCYIDANADLYACADTMGKAQPRNILKLGLREALRTLPPVPCESCAIACHTELNMLFSFRVEAILNWARQI